MERLHLLCNAHLDPYWQWEWEEGAAEAISTFRTAADFCENYDGFIFNHNEVILYQWVEEYEPELFKRIQDLVKAGKWRIMGGWFLQPDCNMPSGESFVRQALVGKGYFQEKFGVEPTTAINFDPFGHTRGLVQILKKTGYDSYIHCRPDQKDCPLPDDDYLWVGYDGSEIHGHRTLGWYGTPRYGEARGKVETFLKEHSERPVGLVLWGVGNHGGGPSRGDLDELKAVMQENADFPIIHSSAEDYFADFRSRGLELPRHEGDINSWAVGCYTSQIRLKQKHRRLENELYATEKMCSHAALAGYMAYPKDEIYPALRDLLVAQFHDILPGSSIQGVEDAGLRLMDHGLEILSRIKARAFFALASGQKKAKEGEIPVLAYNPHPFPVSGIFEVEFNTPDISYEEEFTTPVVYQDGHRLPCQTEKEDGNLNLDWRKRVAFHATLPAGQFSRFDCRLDEFTEGRTRYTMETENYQFRFHTDEVEIIINTATGLMEQYAVQGKDMIAPGAFTARVMADNEDPWTMHTQLFREEAGAFSLLSDQKAARVSGVHDKEIHAVHIIDDGPVRTIVEALFGYGDSFLIVHYKLPKTGTELEVELRVHWNEKDKLLKLAVPTPFQDGAYHGQVAYGRDVLAGHDKEVVAQKWVALESPKQGLVLTCINNGTYGSDCVDGEMRLTLLRSPAYCGHPIAERPIVQQDRYTPRIDQGERLYRFWFNGGAAQERLTAIDREALAKNETPMVLSFFPSGAGETPPPATELSDDALLITAFKQSEDGEDYILRLFEPTGQERTAQLSIPVLNTQEEVCLKAFEIKSYRVDAKNGTMQECDLLERSV